jgi:hypothetical protein
MCEALKWHAHTGHADYGVEDCNFDFSTACFYFFDFGLEGVDQPVIFSGVRVSYLDRRSRRGFGNILDRLFARAVNGSKVQDVVTRLEGQVAQDDVDTRCSIGDENESRGGGVEELHVICEYRVLAC